MHAGSKKTPAESTSWIDNTADDAGRGELVEIRSPFDGAPAARLRNGGEAAIDRAANSARRAFPGWAAATLGERAELLTAAAAEVAKRSDPIVDAMIADIGKPRRAAAFEVNRTTAFMNATARQVHGLHGETIPLDSAKAGAGLHGFARRVPFGVVGAVTPFNAPANLLIQKLAPAAVTGNTVIVKPSPEGTRVALLIAEAFAAAGIPPGVCNVVPGGAAEALALARHPEVDLVTITGGTAAGEALAREAGIRKFIGELGGNSANVVLADADLEDAAPRIAASAFEASGQQCISAQRIIVEASAYDRFVALFVAAAKKLNVGDPNEAETDLGPVVHARAAARISGMIEDAVARGATLLAEPRREGCVIHPTIVADAPMDARVIAEEIFGPVAVVMRAHDFDDAIAQANRCAFGLQASVFTRDLRSAILASERIRAGSVWINEGSRFRLDNYPFGGVGQSGHGREGVRYALEEYTQWKFTGIRLPPARKN
jgi:acyl-CoA reductase-like NAD-dependent aldehyde dehydrogenase